MIRRSPWASLCRGAGAALAAMAVAVVAQAAWAQQAKPLNSTLVATGQPAGMSFPLLGQGAQGGCMVGRPVFLSSPGGDSVRTGSPPQTVPQALSGGGSPELPPPPIQQAQEARP